MRFKLIVKKPGTFEGREVYIGMVWGKYQTEKELQDSIQHIDAEYYSAKDLVVTDAKVPGIEYPATTWL